METKETTQTPNCLNIHFERTNCDNDSVRSENVVKEQFIAACLTFFLQMKQDLQVFMTRVWHGMVFRERSVNVLSHCPRHSVVHYMVACDGGQRCRFILPGVPAYGNLNERQKGISYQKACFYLLIYMRN